MRADFIFPIFPFVTIAVYTRISYFYDWITETACTNFPEDAPSYMNCAKILGLETDAPTDTPANPDVPSYAPSEVPTVTISSTVNGTSPLPEIELIAWTPEEALENCQGDCDNDNDCKGSLKCFQRDGKPETYLVPGCGDPSGLDTSVDICYNASLV